MAAITRIAESESPPRSKNESSTPTRSQPEYLGVDAGQDLFDGVGRGAVLTSVLYSGAGRARVSSLPLTVSGSASTTTTAAGTM